MHEGQSLTCTDDFVTLKWTSHDTWSQVLIPGEVLAPWIEEGGGRPSEEAAETGGVLRLFSTNDYMGLSTHAAVREAASRAALLYGMGASWPPARRRYFSSCLPQHATPLPTLSDDRALSLFNGSHPSPRLAGFQSSD